MSEEFIEQLALRLAEANNGGKWTKHYTDEQKEVWRERARKWSEMVIEEYTDGSS